MNGSYERAKSRFDPFYKELVDLAKDGPEYVSVGIGTSRSYIKANEEIVRRERQRGQTKGSSPLLALNR